MIGVLSLAAAMWLASGFSASAMLPSDAPSARCLRVVKPLDTGGVPADDAFTAVNCPADVSAAFRYDRQDHLARATHALVTGDIVPRYAEFETSSVQPGQKLQLVVGEGLVRVERQVEAMQTARPGQNIFVRSDEGQVLSVPYEGSEP